MSIKVFPKDKWWYIVEPKVPFEIQVEKLRKLSGKKIEGCVLAMACSKHRRGEEGNFCLNHFNVSGISSGASSVELVEEAQELGMTIITWNELLSPWCYIRKELTA